jgi:hypothetical protein
MGYLRVKTNPDVCILGTYEMVPGTAGIQSVTLDEKGEFTWEWVGGTEMWWDDSKTQEKDGKTVFVGDDGGLYTSDEVELVQNDPEDQEEA